MIHPTAIVETDNIGPSTNVWAYAHIMSGAIVGDRVNIGDHAFVESGATVGNNVTIKNGVCIWEGVSIDDDAFVGPNVTFTNDRFPRSPRMPGSLARYAHKETWLAHTQVQRGCSIGAGAIICPGVTLGPYSMIAAGAVVTKDVQPFSLVVGSPARSVAAVCVCGAKLSTAFDDAVCLQCGQTGSERLKALDFLTVP